MIKSIYGYVVECSFFDYVVVFTTSAPPPPPSQELSCPSKGDPFWTCNDEVGHAWRYRALATTLRCPSKSTIRKLKSSSFTFQPTACCLVWETKTGISMPRGP